MASGDMSLLDLRIATDEGYKMIKVTKNHLYKKEEDVPQTLLSICSKGFKGLQVFDLAET